MRLRTRILVLFALLGVFPVLALGAFTYLRSMKAVESLLGAETASIAERIVSDLQERYALRAGELQLIAGNVETERLYRAHERGQDPSDSEALAGVDPYLTSLWQLFHPSYDWIELRDSAGAPIYLMEEAAPSEGQRTTEPSAVELRFPVTLPPDDDTVGVVVAAVRSGALLSDELVNATFGAAGYTTLLDRSRATVLRHPRRRFLNQTTARLFSQDSWNVDPSVLASDSGSFVYRESDSVRVASFRNVASPPWTVVVSASVDEFASPFARVRSLNLTVMVLVAAAVGLFFFFMTRRATLSLEQLTAAADDVARGELSPWIPEGGSDEVGRLSRAFALMVEEVRKMLGTVEEARHMAVMGEFASRVSHEIRTPLTSIKLNLQELGRDVEGGNIPEESVPAVRICLREVERLDRAVSDVLGMVRRHPPGRERCSLHRILADATEAVRPQLERENVRVEHQFEAVQDEVLGDPRDLEAVFVNLLVNAGEAMPEGGTVRIHTQIQHFEASTSGIVQVRVSDEGPGVPTEIRGKIFRPFVSTKPEGTGFGLAIARRTVEEHGGRIDLDPDSSPGQGAIIVVDLPLAGDTGNTREAT